MDKEKKYPLIKAIFNRKKRFECVYAGPPAKPGPMEGVYAGPRNDTPVGRVYAGPAPKNDEAEFEDVYAGPEFFEREVEPDEIVEEICEPEDDADRAMKEAAKKAPVQTPIMLTYAGPAFNQGGQPIGMFFTPPQTNAPSGPLCERCGMPVPETAKFCPNCGTPLIKNV